MAVQACGQLRSTPWLGVFAVAADAQRRSNLSSTPPRPVHPWRPAGELMQAGGRPAATGHLGYPVAGGGGHPVELVQGARLKKTLNLCVQTRTPVPTDSRSPSQCRGGGSSPRCPRCPRSPRCPRCPRCPCRRPRLRRRAAKQFGRKLADAGPGQRPRQQRPAPVALHPDSHVVPGAQRHAALDAAMLLLLLLGPALAATSWLPCQAASEGATGRSCITTCSSRGVLSWHSPLQQQVAKRSSAASTGRVQQTGHTGPHQAAPT